LPAKTQTLRIIGGEYRGRRLEFKSAEGLRPTSDRLRETLFNWLQPVIAGARCLDMFAGSGLLGIEAASRGAAEVVFIDQVPADPAQIKLTRPKWHWEFGQEIMLEVEASLNYNIVGAVEISSFQCGSDSVLKEFVEERFKQN